MVRGTCPNTHTDRTWIQWGGVGLDRAGNTPLHWAARSGHLPVVQRLLAEKPIVDAQVSPWSPFRMVQVHPLNHTRTRTRA